MQPVLIKVSYALQRLYYEIDSQSICLNFKAGFGKRFTSFISYFFTLGLYTLHTGLFFLLHKSNTDEKRTPKQCTNNYCSW